MSGAVPFSVLYVFVEQTVTQGPLTSCQVVFGILSNRFCHKWPLGCNLVLVAILELGIGFVQRSPQFLALRSLFGIGVSGIWGLAADTAPENLAVEACGISSGFLQQGYAGPSDIFSQPPSTCFCCPKSVLDGVSWTASGISLFSNY